MLKSLNYSVLESKATVLFFLFSLTLLYSCNQTSQNISNEKYTDDIIEVKTIELKADNFNIEILANGKITFAQKAQLRFRSIGIIQNIFVKNGDMVLANYPICFLENTIQKIALEKAINQLGEAKLAMKGKLIEYGLSTKDTSLPANANAMEYIKISTGYNKAQTAVKEAIIQLNYTEIRAPFSGQITGLKCKTYNYVNENEMVCNLIDQHMVEIEVPILESEVSSLNKNQKCFISPLSNDSIFYVGFISEIDPSVSANGLIFIKIRLDSFKDGLIDGMNVRVKINKILQNQIVIPKKSLVQRSGRCVVFTYENGFAKWNYVTIKSENSNSYCISTGLKIGDKIITDGNITIEQGTSVKLIPQ